MKSLEDIRKSLIREEQNFEEKELAELGEKISNIAELDESGSINFKIKNLTDKEKIRGFLIARYMARKIEDFFKDKDEENRILPHISREEIEKLLKKPNAQIRARISEMRRDNEINEINKNEYEIKSHKISEILEEFKK